MTSRFRVTKGARRSLQEIHTYYRDQGGQHLADRILSELYDAMVKLAEQPTLGHYRPDLTDSPFRFFRVRNHLIIYNAELKPLRIMQVYHAARDIAGLLRDR
jgi:plasmid stabilization system protein ParE